MSCVRNVLDAASGIFATGLCHLTVLSPLETLATEAGNYRKGVLASDSERCFNPPLNRFFAGVANGVGRNLAVALSPTRREGCNTSPRTCCRIVDTLIVRESRDR